MRNVRTTEYGQGTSLTTYGSWDTFVAARVLCSDGMVRTVRRIAMVADTYSTVPCSVKVKGKTVSGYLTVETMQGLDTEIESDPKVVKFVAIKTGVNAGMLPAGAFRSARE